MSKDKEESRKITAFLIYPFGHPQFQNSERLKATIKILYYRGYAVVVPPTAIVSSGFWSFDLSILKALIESCSVAVLCYEDFTTERMCQEMLYARSSGKQIVRIDIKKAGD